MDRICIGGGVSFFLKYYIFRYKSGISVEKLNFVVFVNCIIFKEDVSLSFFIKFDMKGIMDFWIITIFKYIKVS